MSPGRDVFLQRAATLKASRTQKKEILLPVECAIARRQDLLSPSHYTYDVTIIGDIKTQHNDLNTEVILGNQLTSCSASSVVNHPTPAHSYSPMLAVSFSLLTVAHHHHHPKQHNILLAQNSTQY